MVIARSFKRSGIRRPCAVVPVVAEECGEFMDVYGAWRKALAVPGAYACGDGRLYIAGSPGLTIECDLY